MRIASVFVAFLCLSAVAGCDFVMPDSATSDTDVAVEPTQAPVDIVARTKSTGTVIYEGGSRGLEIPRSLEFYYTATGAVAVKGSLVDPISTGKTGGASFAVAADAEDRFSGKTITIKVVSSADQPGEAFLAYSTNEVGNSGWVSFPVTTEDSVATITYSVAPKVEGLGDFIGIDPNGTELIIKAIVVEVNE